jgi:DNA-binding XRE family transcriptional regulator
MVESPKTGSEQFGDAVRRARERRGMSRRDLAETTGLSYPYISQIETGYRMPSTPALRSLADALGLRPDTLFEAIPPTGHDAETPRPAAAPAASASPFAGPPTPPAAAPTPPLTRRAQGPATGGSPPAPAGGGAGAMSAGAPARPTSVDPRPDSATADPRTGSSDTAGGPADLSAGAAGGWLVNQSFRPVVARTAMPEITGARDQAVDRAAALLNSLPTKERLPALTEVQARVVRAVVDDEIRRDRAQDRPPDRAR